MNRALQWKLIAGFVLVFIAGGVTGAFFAATQARHFLFPPPEHGAVAAHMRDRLRIELKLTPEQMEKIGPFIDKAGAQLEDVRRDTGRRVHETFMQSHREISPYLTEEQRAKLQRMETRHRGWHHGPHGRGAPMRRAPKPAEPPALESPAM